VDFDELIDFIDCQSLPYLFRRGFGKVAEVDEERGKVKVLVPVFGRDTLVELDSLQVQKM